MFGFQIAEDLPHPGNPESPRYWKNIIPKDYNIFNREGIISFSDELDESLLSYDFFPRFGAGIGLTRMARAMKLEGLI